jgi:hypothetical protein
LKLPIEFGSLLLRKLSKKNDIENDFIAGSQNQILGTVLSLRTGFTFLGAFFLIYFSFKIFRVDWTSTLDTFKTLDIVKYFIAFAAYYLSFLFRGLRWKTISLNASVLGISSGCDSVLSHTSSFKYSVLVLSGWFVNSVTWLRLGDVYRAYCLGVISKLGFSWGIGTLVAERFLDMIIVFTMILVSVMMLSSDVKNQALDFLVIFAFIITATLAAFVLLLALAGKSLVSRLPNSVRSHYSQFKIGVLNSFKNIFMITSLGLAAWFMEITRLFFVADSLNVDISIYLIILATMSNAVLSTFPTPGGIGIVEPGLTGILIISVSSSDAASITLLDRSITYLSVLILGGITFLLYQAWFQKRSKMMSIGNVS